MSPYVPLSSGPQALWLESVLYIRLILLSGYWWLKGISYTFPSSLQISTVPDLHGTSACQHLCNKREEKGLVCE